MLLFTEPDVGEIWTNSQRSASWKVSWSECCVSAGSCLLEFSSNFQFCSHRQQQPVSSSNLPYLFIYFFPVEYLWVTEDEQHYKNVQVVVIKGTTVCSSVVRVDVIVCEYNAYWFELTVEEYWPACSVHSYKPKLNNGCFCTASHKG